MSGMNGLPTGWTLGKIGDLVSTTGVFCDGDWVESEDQDPNGDVRLIQLADIGDGQYVNKSRRFLTSEKAASLRCTFLESGDVLIARMPDPLGRACIFPGDSRRAVTAVDVCIVRTGTKEIDHRWLVWFVNSPQFRVRVAGLQSGSTRARISRGNLATIPLSIPPAAEQRRIVAKIEELFSDLDASVAALKRVRANLKRYRAAVLKAAVEGRLTEHWRQEHPPAESASKLLERILIDRRKKWEQEQLAKYATADKPTPKNWREKYQEPAAPDVANLPELPADWCWATVDQLITYLRNGWSLKPEPMPPGHRILRINAVRPMSLDLNEFRFVDRSEDEVAAYFIEPNDLLFTRYNGSVELLGVSALVGELPTPTLHPDKLIRVKAALGPPLPGFLEIATNVGLSRKHMQSRARTTAGQTGISGTDIREMPVPLCPLDEQSEINREVHQRLSTATAVEAEITSSSKRATRLRQSILKRAFDGKLVHQDPADESASALLERIASGRNTSAAGSNGRKPRERRAGTKRPAASETLFAE